MENENEIEITKRKKGGNKTVHARRDQIWAWRLWGDTVVTHKTFEIFVSLSLSNQLRNNHQRLYSKLKFEI